MPPNLTLITTIPDTAISVGGLTDYIKQTLEDDDRLHHVWVVGEVSSAKSHSSGLFFTLQDPEAEAAIACVVWSSQRQKLAIAPEVGTQVVVLASMRVYPKRGTYSLNVWQVLPAGEGLRALRYQQLQQQLAAEGCFDADRKHPLPAYPQTIAVVTSPQAAAWGDVQRTLQQRHPGLRVLLSPTQVQGFAAPAAIVRALEAVVEDGRAEVILLTRGGGAVEDLWCFNDERVVRAIATCPLPVLTGIGHERDETLADLAADAFAHTPTAAAELVVPALADLRAGHQGQIDRLYTIVAHRLQQEHQHCDRLRQRLQRQHPQRQIEHQQARLDWQRRQLGQLLRQRLERAQQHHTQLKDMLAVLDPAAILQRGYAVVRDRQQLVRSVTTLAPGQTITLQLSDGNVQTIVQSIQPTATQS